MYIVCVYSEERAAQSLLVTTQLNRKRPKPPPSPELPNQMMSKERKIRVWLTLFPLKSFQLHFAVKLRVFKEVCCIRSGHAYGIS